jgi:hypothetical protein
LHPLGFRREFARRTDDRNQIPATGRVARHISPRSPAMEYPAGVAHMIVDDVDARQAGFVAKAVRIAVEAVDQAWRPGKCR